jgi:hypothetical protein
MGTSLVNILRGFSQVHKPHQYQGMKEKNSDLSKNLPKSEWLGLGVWNQPAQTLTYHL